MINELNEFLFYFSFSLVFFFKVIMLVPQLGYFSLLLRQNFKFFIYIKINIYFMYFYV